MDQPLTGARTFTIDGRTFVRIGESAFEVVRDGAAAIGTSAVGGATLGAAALYVAGAPAVPVSREEAMQIGAQERAMRDHAIANAHGKPVALPEASPFSNEAFVSRLPTQAELDRGITVLPVSEMVSPHPEAGTSPILESRRPLKVDLANARDEGATKTAMDQCRPGFKSFDSQAQLEDHMLQQGKFRGVDANGQSWQLHHLVEQGRGTPAYGSHAIQNEVNAIYLPKDVHEYISARMSGTFVTQEGEPYSHLRDYVGTLNYDQQRNLGIKMVREALDKTNATQQVRNTVEKELQSLDVPELQDFCKTIPQKPKPEIDPSQIQPLLDQHNDSHDSRMPPMREAKPWDGKPRDGTFVDLGNGQVAQHQGRGDYAVMDVQRDFGGVRPPIGRYVGAQQIAQVQMGQAQSFEAPSPSMGIGR